MGFSEHDLQLAEVFVHLADSLQAGHDVVDVMDALAQAATRFTAATDAGILLVDSGGVLHVVASTNECTSDVEEAQLGYDQGPCLDCFRTGKAVEIPDLSKERGRWPQFVTIAESRGMRAAHTFPLRLRDDIFGAMNLFSPTPGLLSDWDSALAAAFAQVAAIGLVQKQTDRDHMVVTNQLQDALDSRVLIEQAKGVLAQRHGVPIDAAFVLLRNHARTNSSRLRDIADGIVNRGLTV
jgi:hypothetical protein